MSKIIAILCLLVSMNSFANPIELTHEQISKIVKNVETCISLTSEETKGLNLSFSGGSNFQTLNGTELYSLTAKEKTLNGTVGIVVEMNEASQITILN